MVRKLKQHKEDEEEEGGKEELINKEGKFQENISYT